MQGQIHGGGGSLGFEDPQVMNNYLHVWLIKSVILPRNEALQDVSASIQWISDPFSEETGRSK